ncbi:hypothetical protein ACQKWADRAFT_231189 [Trichoderma austrokoningii]
MRHKHSALLFIQGHGPLEIQGTSPIFRLMKPATAYPKQSQYLANDVSVRPHRTKAKAQPDPLTSSAVNPSFSILLSSPILIAGAIKYVGFNSGMTLPFSIVALLLATFASLLSPLSSPLFFFFLNFYYRPFSLKTLHLAIHTSAPKRHAIPRAQPSCSVLCVPQFGVIWLPRGDRVLRCKARPPDRLRCKKLRLEAAWDGA